MITVDWNDLGIGSAKPFAQGAVGEIYHVPREVPGLPGHRLVFKKVKDTLPQGVDRQHTLDNMRRVVQLRDALEPDEVRVLDEVTAWPLAMVCRGGKDVGILLERIADDFFVDAKNLDGSPDRVLFELQFLCVTDSYFKRTGIDPSVTGDHVMRLALAVRLAYAIEIVHRHGVVFGDLHLKNAVAASRPFARVLLMDCDGVADLSDRNRVQLHGPGFVPPEIQQKLQKLQDHETDVYKLGLCIIKALSPGPGATQARDPAKTMAGALDAEGIKLLNRAVSVNRKDRPTAAELREYLARRVRGLIRLPELLDAGLVAGGTHATRGSHLVVVQGTAVYVRWTQQHGETVRIFGTNGYIEENIDASVGAHAIQPPAPGPIWVEVSNRHGPHGTPALAGHVDYVKLPELTFPDLTGVLAPSLPHTPALDVSMMGTLKPYPVPSPPDLKIEYKAPTISFPSMTVDVDAAWPEMSGGPTGLLSHTHGEANRIVEETVRGAVDRMSAAILDRFNDSQRLAPEQLPLESPPKPSTTDDISSATA